jgi:hypothetical protein
MLQVTREVLRCPTLFYSFRAELQSISLEHIPQLSHVADTISPCFAFQRPSTTMLPRKLRVLLSEMYLHYIYQVMRVPAEDNKCISCWRAFNTRDDASDSTEQPCYPLRIQPCDHLIGSHCLEEMTRRHMETCPHCRAPMTGFNSVPAILNPLLDKLFEGTLNVHEGLQLWGIFMRSPLIDMMFAMILLFVVNFTFVLLVEPLLAMLPSSWHMAQYALFILGKDVGQVVLLYNMVLFSIFGYYSYLGYNMQRLHLGPILLAIAMRYLAKLFGLHILLVLLTATWALYGAMMAYCLFWLGWGVYHSHNFDL